MVLTELIVHPGETLQELLEDRGISVSELAVKTGSLPEYIGNVLDGHEAISDEFATQLERALGIGAEFWMNLQENYAREKEQLIREKIKVVDCVQ